MHEYGIDRLARMWQGRRAIDLLYDHAKELQYRPDEDEIIRLGKTLVRFERELGRLCSQARCNRPTPKYGFVRGPKAGG